MIAKVATRGRVTIPKKLRDILKIQVNDRIDFERDGEKIIVVPIKTLQDFRDAVRTKRKSCTFEAERSKAKAAVAKRVIKEMA